MSDFIIKEDGKLYELLKSKNLLDEDKIKEKIENCLDFEDFIFDVDDTARLCLKPEIYKSKIENMEGEELQTEAIKALNLTKETINNVIDFIEDRFGKLFEISEGDYILIDDFPKMTALKYVGEILPMVMEKYLKDSENKISNEQTKKFVYNMCSLALGKDKPENLSDELISKLYVFFYNRLRGALTHEEVELLYLMYGQDRTIETLKEELQRIESLSLRRLRHPKTITMLKGVMERYN